MEIKINIKQLLIFSFAFSLFTAIGTVSHEYGHVTIAKLLGYETALYHSSMSYFNTELNDRYLKIYNENRVEIEAGTDFNLKEEYKNIFEKSKSDDLLVTIGGPAQTVLTAIVGLIILFLRRKKIRVKGFKFFDWLAVFLSLFWSREVFNVVMSIGNEIIKPNGSYFSGDEKNISELLNLWPGTISVLLGVFGLIISLFVIFKIVPNKTRLTFILSGLIGSIIGFILWMDVIGPRLIP